MFSGIGGFELAWQRAGGTVAWMCESDPAARRVLEAHFPGVPIYPDIATLDPNELPPVEVIAGGSPCQGFSIAGARTGMGHAESRLFADYVRILAGLRARGLRWAVWENVPGVLSITNDDGERTFEHVVAALLGADEPVRLDHRVRWNSGLAARGTRGLAWRILDSRHFGVPQRRRRVYAVIAFGRAGPDRAYRALLALPTSLSRDPASCQTRQGAPRAATGSARCGVARGVTSGQYRLFDDRFVPEVAHTLRAAGHDSSEDGTGRGTPLVTEAFDARQSHVLTYGQQAGPLDTDGHSNAVLLRNREGSEGGGKGPLLASDESLTLATGNDQILFTPQSIAQNQRGEIVATDHAHAISAGGGTPGQGYPAIVEPVSFALRGRDGGAQPEVYEQGTDVGALRGAGGSSRDYLGTAYGVRRLTPVECERLQAFADGWTEAAGSDAARYRALGNAVTVTVPTWLFTRLREIDA